MSGYRLWREIKHKRAERFAVDPTSVRCAECDLRVDEPISIADGWRYFSDGHGDLLPYCPACAQARFRR